jgi:hypothetical protein
MNQHIKNLSLPLRLLMIAIPFVIEFLVFGLLWSAFIPTVLVTAISSIVFQYKIIQPHLIKATNLKSLYAKAEPWHTISRVLMAVGLYLLFIRLAGKDISGAQFGHVVFCIGTALSSAATFTKSRIILYKAETGDPLQP